MWDAAPPSFLCRLALGSSVPVPPHRSASWCSGRAISWRKVGAVCVRPPRGLTACYFFLAVFLAAFLAVFLAAFFAVFFAIVPPELSGPAFMAATDVSLSVAWADVPHTRC